MYPQPIPADRYGHGPTKGADEFDGLPGFEDLCHAPNYTRRDWCGPYPLKVWAPTGNADGRWCREVLSRDPCVYCGGAVEVIDHIHNSAGGGDNDWTNYTGACRKCNTQKGGKGLLFYLLRKPALDALPHWAVKAEAAREARMEAEIQKAWRR